MARGSSRPSFFSFMALLAFETCCPARGEAFPTRGQQVPILFFYLVLILITLTACLPSRLILISPSLTSSSAALTLVLLGIFVTSVDNTISPPICSCRNASIKITRASRYVPTLPDCRKTSTHRSGNFAQCGLKRRLPFFLFTAGCNRVKASLSVI